ncbi:MAG: hypothetical protein POELPBGB_03181 [Bacteroidia bacterium]|nr:hypothetical protein [Bacteroidia bacterium]
MSGTIDLTVSHQQGGFRYFIETGLYRDVLVFYSPSLKRSWHFKWGDEKEKGSLKIKGEVVFNFIYDDKGCRVQKVTKGKAEGDWVSIPFSIEMTD